VAYAAGQVLAIVLNTRQDGTREGTRLIAGQGHVVTTALSHMIRVLFLRVAMW
jgi:hypothetical protein